MAVLRACEATVTVRASPVTHRGNSALVNQHKRSQPAAPALTGGLHTHTVTMGDLNIKI